MQILALYILRRFHHAFTWCQQCTKHFKASEDRSLPHSILGAQAVQGKGNEEGPCLAGMLEQRCHCVINECQWHEGNAGADVFSMVGVFFCWILCCSQWNTSVGDHTWYCATPQTLWNAVKILCWFCCYSMKGLCPVLLNGEVAWTWEALEETGSLAQNKLNLLQQVLFCFA